MKSILIYGASGHAKMIVDILNEDKNYNIIGFIDRYKTSGEVLYGYPILGDLSAVSKLVRQYNIEGIVIAIGDNYSRKRVYEEVKNTAPSLDFISVIHKSAVIAKEVEIASGTVIMPNVVVNADAKIGQFCILNTASILGHDSKMNDFSSLASRVAIAGNVVIGHCSAICLSASIIQNVIIGNYTVIGAGSLVLKSIGDFKQATGSPINCVKRRNMDSRYLGQKI